MATLMPIQGRDTPVKSVSSCVCCGKPKSDGGQFYRVETRSRKSTENSLANLLERYGGLKVVHGFACRKCHFSVQRIHKSATDFWDMCQESSKTSKRCAFSPLTPSVSNETETTNHRKVQRRLIMSADSSSTSSASSVVSTLDLALNYGEMGNLGNVSNTKQDYHDHTYAKDHFNTGTARKNGQVPTKKSLHNISRNLGSSQLLAKSLTKDDSSLSQSLTRSDKCLLTEAINSFSAYSAAEAVMKTPTLKSAVEKLFLQKVDHSISELNRRKVEKGYVSELMVKDYKNLIDFKWLKVVEEIDEKVPELLNMMITVCAGQDGVTPEKLETLLPRIGMAYSILVQSRHHELSRVQRILTMCLHDSTCEQKVFDRLQQIGVSLSYGRSLFLLSEVGGHFNEKVIEAVKQGHRFRLIGDNLNFHVNVQDMRKDRQNTNHHMFASAIILQTPIDCSLMRNVPQKSIDDIHVNDILISNKELDEVKDEYVKLVCDIAGEHIPSLAFMKKCVPSFIVGPHSDQLKRKNEVIAMPVLPYNEQSYADDVKILAYYEEAIKEIYTSAGLQVDDNVKVHIGGDQLTRERFSHAKRFRIGNLLAHERFDHLGPTSFELFHLDMNFLEKIAFKWLYDEGSSNELGTMKSEQQRILRKNVDPDVRKAFDADQAFFISFVKSYIVALLLSFFGMETSDGTPTKNVPPPFSDESERKAWVRKTVGHLVEENVLSTWRGRTLNQQDSAGKIDVIELLPVTLKNGTQMFLPVYSPEVMFMPPKEDYVMNYSNLVIDLGLLYLNFHDACHLPNRDRMMRIFKMFLPVFKGSNNQSKYALELLRFLIQHISILSESESHRVFYGLFVNNQGGINTHIRADQQMEYIVKQQKKLIKHCYSNKTNKNILRHTAAVHGVSVIGEGFDAVTRVIRRAKAHPELSAVMDEKSMVSDLISIKPWNHSANRKFEHFPTIQRTLVGKMDPAALRKWFSEKKWVFYHEVGK